MTVLILSSREDPTAGRVADALRDRDADFVMADLADFPDRLALTATSSDHGWHGRLSTPERDLPLADIGAVYYRRPTSFGINLTMTPEHHRFAMAEARQGLGGLLIGLPARFVNHPSRIADAELKPLQLRVAAQCGFAVPPTLLTSSIREVHAFAERVGEMIYKPLSAPYVREIDHDKLIYATLLDDTDVAAHDAEIAQTVCQFQAWIPKRYDVRVTAVGGRSFATSIHAATAGAHRDWRSDYGALSYEVIEPPHEVAAAVGAYLQAFGLSFGCFDFSVDGATGQWWFLECNANGQWGWIEQHTGQPIAAAIAALLTEEAQ